MAAVVAAATLLDDAFLRVAFLAVFFLVVTGLVDVIQPFPTILVLRLRRHGFEWSGGI
jgi:hypothetical protein